MPDRFAAIRGGRSTSAAPALMSLRPRSKASCYCWGLALGSGRFHFVDIPPQPFVFVGDVLELEHVLDAEQQPVLIDRLADEVIRAGLHGPLDITGFVEGGDHQNQR